MLRRTRPDSFYSPRNITGQSAFCFGCLPTFWNKGKYNKNLDDELMDCSICQDVSLLSDFNEKKRKGSRCFQQIYKKQQSSSELGGNHRPPRKGGRGRWLCNLCQGADGKESGLRRGGKLGSSDALAAGTTNFSLETTCYQS